MNKVLFIVSTLALFVGLLHLFLDFAPQRAVAPSYPAQNVAITAVVTEEAVATESATPTTKKTPTSKSATSTATPTE